MTRVEIYDTDYEALDKCADANDTTIAEVIGALVDQFISEVEV